MSGAITTPILSDDGGLYVPPDSDEIELVFFGPGVGESILVHAGDDVWFAVDSAKKDSKTWALDYLQRMGKNPSAAIKLIVATHWHSDHVAGISALVDACPQAQFVCSAALHSQEFRQIVARSDDDTDLQLQAPIKEIRSIFSLLAKRSKGKKLNHPPPILTKATDKIFQQLVLQKPVEVWSLSPSAQEYLKSLEQFKDIFVAPQQFLSGISRPLPNHSSVVLHIQIDDVAVLLGSDLENKSNSNMGWEAIISSTTKPTKLAAVFKVPHHGSKTAYSPSIWKNLVEQDHFAVLTPFTSSGLPREAQIAAIKSHGGIVYATALPKKVMVKRGREVEKAIQNVAKKAEAFDGLPKNGVVRLRKKMTPGAKWKTELFGTAQQL